jgi:regulator of cell morphogenesis and NO signaling
MIKTTSPAPLAQHTLADIVTADARAAAVFDRAGLDYCCHGHQTLAEAASERGLALEPVLTEIAALGPSSPETRAFSEAADLDGLTEHIVDKHHRYVRETAPVLEQWLGKLVSRHGERHPELAEVQRTFAAVADELRKHMMKEENILFPYIDALAAAARNAGRLPASPFGTILNPIRIMEEDHRQAGDHVERLRNLTNAYAPPPDGCATYRLCYEELGRFAADLHRHVHLENNVLFPRAAELEQRLG